MDGQTDGRTEGASAQYHLISYIWNSCYAFGVPRAPSSACNKYDDKCIIESFITNTSVTFMYR